MKNKVILKIRAGSHLHGLNTPESDQDYIGIYLNTSDEIFGLNSSQIIEENIESKKENGRNDKDAIDCKYYELRKFCNMALNANPTMLEVLFVNKENIIEINNFGQKLLDNKNLFLSSKAKSSYLGYALGQKNKSQVKSENLRKLFEAREFLTSFDCNLWLYDTIEDDTFGAIQPDDNYPDYVIIADLKFNNQKIKDVLKSIDNRLNKSTHRADGMLQHGLDFKFISHTLRLILEGKELLTTGKITFPLKDRELLLQVKTGKIKPTKVMDIIDKEEKEVKKIYEKSVLPAKSDFNAANKIIIEIYKEYLGVE